MEMLSMTFLICNKWSQKMWSWSPKENRSWSHRERSSRSEIHDHVILHQFLEKTKYYLMFRHDLKILTINTDCIIKVCIMSDPRSSPSIIINTWPSTQQWRNVDEENNNENDPSIMSQKFCHFGKDYSKNSTDGKHCQW